MWVSLLAIFPPSPMFISFLILSLSEVTRALRETRGNDMLMKVDQLDTVRLLVVCVFSPLATLPSVSKAHPTCGYGGHASYPISLFVSKTAFIQLLFSTQARYWPVSNLYLFVPGTFLVGTCMHTYPIPPLAIKQRSLFLDSSSNISIIIAGTVCSLVVYSG
ncbi:hypothetical protein B0T26DRAFT_205908 [Lasiosphaeria miniovina]|uniref:Uncharacterized protein n=1 Tax=Lasiosphaeria miniovina TaxID=1954250 RepID=A0AA40AUC2_9PEZI|nr:uncharacterized protein B0T26DRAFT_205908 [Lasiosphaeria miniovina]KAK0722175.1 hypothetical protein B0T26DRAFT_205908 [Lasiosphaeria miniovina]